MKKLQRGGCESLEGDEEKASLVVLEGERRLFSNRDQRGYEGTGNWKGNAALPEWGDLLKTQSNRRFKNPSQRRAKQTRGCATESSGTPMV